MRDDELLGEAVEALERGPPSWTTRSAGELELFESLVAAGRFERARALGERLSPALRGEAEETRIPVALAHTALIRLDLDEAGRRLDAARACAGSTPDERLELLPASIAGGPSLDY